MTGENLKIRDPKSGLSVVTADQGGTAGLWVSNDNPRPDHKGGADCVALVYQPQVGPYLCVWQPGDKSPMAVTHDGVQLPQEKGESLRFISWDDLYEVVELHKANKRLPS